MKKQQLLYLSASIFMLGLVGCTPNSIILEGKVSNASGKTISYYSTMDGICRPTQRDTLVLQPDSSYRLTVPARGNEKYSFYVYGERSLGSVYLAPGKNVMDIDASLKNSLHVDNKLMKENEIVKDLAQLQEDVFDLRARRGDVFQITKDTVASSVYQKLIDYAEGLEQKVTGVDEVFRERAIQDIRMQVLLAFMNQYFGISYRGTETTKEEWELVYPKMLDYAGIDHPENVFSEAFQNVISNVGGIELFMKDNQMPKDRNESNLKLFDWYKEHLKGRVQEVAMANIILDDASNESYSTCMPALFDQFKELHSSSPLMPALDEAIRKNIAFNNLEIPEGVHVLNTDSVRSFKEIADRYLGKVVFVDVWATWCSPCRESFAHVKPLQQYAKENDIVLLYISVDRPTEAELWKKLAAYYDLKGEHVIINDFFKMDIYRTFGNNETLYLPQCAIINKKGELQFKKAASPEDMDKLIKQLQEAGE